MAMGLDMALPLSGVNARDGRGRTCQPIAWECPRHRAIDDYFRFMLNKEMVK